MKEGGASSFQTLVRDKTKNLIVHLALFLSFRPRRLRHAYFAEASKAESSAGYELSAEGFGPQADG